MKFRSSILAAVGTGLTLLAGPADASATRGGWATVSYDPLPALVAGEPADVSFRVLQHGVTVLTPDSWGPDPGAPRHGGLAGLEAIRLEATGPDGKVEAPTSVDAQGRFTASFTVPAGADTINLAVLWNDGLFFQQEPIAVPVTAPDGTATWPDWLPYGFGVVALAGVGLVATDVRTRRRLSTPRPDPEADLVTA